MMRRPVYMKFELKKLIYFLLINSMNLVHLNFLISNPGWENGGRDPGVKGVKLNFHHFFYHFFDHFWLFFDHFFGHFVGFQNCSSWSETGTEVCCPYACYPYVRCPYVRACQFHNRQN